MTELELYYNKFNEEKRLDSRHGQVEFRVTMKYIKQALEELGAGRDRGDVKILDKNTSENPMASPAGVDYVLAVRK